MTRVWLGREPLTARELIAALDHDGAGAGTTFVGIVRPEMKNGHALVALDYHAYEEMAMEQMIEIQKKARDRFDICDAGVAHRLGRMAIGEVSIAVAVSAAHRAAAFDACRWIVDAVKADVPIWKQDVWSDGTRTWVDPA